MAGIVISVLILFKMIFSQPFCIGLTADGQGCVSPVGKEAFLFNIGTIHDYLPLIIFYLIFLPIFICFIIGLIYGKIKNRNKVCVS